MNRDRLRHHLPSLSFVGASIVALVIATAAFVYFGVYNIAADVPHTPAVYALLDGLRDRSIAIRARGITTPSDLNSAKRMSIGAGLYNEMCTSCHLGPGVERSELSQGLYPQAPELNKSQDLTAAQQFWIIKHGVKLSAMPAWGKTHPDPLIWDMVAFIRRMPGMTPDEYKRLVASAPADHDKMMLETKADRQIITTPRHGDRAMVRSFADGPLIVAIARRSIWVGQAGMLMGEAGWSIF